MTPTVRQGARDHPLRASLSSQMHSRRLPELCGPDRVLQYVVLMEDAEQHAATAELTCLLSPYAAIVVREERYQACPLGTLWFSRERHTEFITYSFVAEDNGEQLFDLAPFSMVAGWVESLSGRVIRSTHIRFMRKAATPERIAAAFDVDDLVVSDVAGGSARIWCDFRLHDDGFGRLLILDAALRGAELPQLVQRLKELGNYRKLALLGLPVAQEGMPCLSLMESELTVRIAHSDVEPERLLEELSELSADLAVMLARSRYPMSATQAYADICLDRMGRLTVQPVLGYVSFDDFTKRRLLPAVRTCEEFSRRLEDLSQRAAWTSALLRTRVDTALARQNRDLLASMDRRTALHRRLQHTVEGLFVVAISYYGIGLWHYLQEALMGATKPFPFWVELVVVLGVIAAVWMSSHRLRRIITTRTENDEATTESSMPMYIFLAYANI